jgi:hypothetical protein
MGGEVAGRASHREGSPGIAVGGVDGRGERVGRSAQTGPSGPGSIPADGRDAHRRLSSPCIAERGYEAAEPDAHHTRLAHMHTLPRRHGSRSRALGLVLAVLVVPALAACSSAGAPSVGRPPSEPAASAAPSQDPNTPVGIDQPPSEDPALIDPLGRVVVPKPGQLDVRAIPAQTLSAAVAGRRVTLTIDYSSGVEPCYILDSIVVAVGADGGTFAITLREGHGPGDVVCIEIAQSKRAIVDLGELAPGTYTISDAAGGAAPISVIVG